MVGLGPRYCVELMSVPRYPDMWVLVGDGRPLTVGDPYDLPGWTCEGDGFPTTVRGLLDTYSSCDSFSVSLLLGSPVG